MKINKATRPPTPIRIMQPEQEILIINKRPATPVNYYVATSSDSKPVINKNIRPPTPVNILGNMLDVNNQIRITTPRPPTPLFNNNNTQSGYKREHLENLKKWETEPDIKKSLDMFKEHWLSECGEYVNSMADEITISKENLDLYKEIYQDDNESVDIFGPMVIIDDITVDYINIRYDIAKSILPVVSYYRDLHQRRLDSKSDLIVVANVKQSIPPTLNRAHLHNHEENYRDYLWSVKDVNYDNLPMKYEDPVEKVMKAGNTVVNLTYKKIHNTNAWSVESICLPGHLYVN